MRPRRAWASREGGKTAWTLSGRSGGTKTLRRLLAVANAASARSSGESLSGGSAEALETACVQRATAGSRCPRRKGESAQLDRRRRGRRRDAHRPRPPYRGEPGMPPTCLRRTLRGDERCAETRNWFLRDESADGRQFPGFVAAPAMAHCGPSLSAESCPRRALRATVLPTVRSPAAGPLAGDSVRRGRRTVF